MLSLAQTDPWAGIPVGEHLFYFSPMIMLVCTMVGAVATHLNAGEVSMIGAPLVLMILSVLVAWGHRPSSTD